MDFLFIIFCGCIIHIFTCNKIMPYPGYSMSLIFILQWKLFKVKLREPKYFLMLNNAYKMPRILLGQCYYLVIIRFFSWSVYTLYEFQCILFWSILITEIFVFIRDRPMIARDAYISVTKVCSTFLFMEGN